MVRQVCLFIAALLLVAPGARAENELMDSAIEVANGFSECSGFYLYLSDFAESQGKPANAEGMRNYANGAKTAALYYLAMAWSADHPKEPRTLVSFAPLVDGRIATARTRFNALAESQDQASLQAQFETCKQVLPAQEDAIQKLRSQAAGIK